MQTTVVGRVLPLSPLFLCVYKECGPGGSCAAGYECVSQTYPVCVEK